LFESVNVDGSDRLVAHAEVQRQAVVGGLKDGSLASALLAGLFQRISHDGFAMTPAPVFGERRDIVHADCARGSDGRRRGYGLSVHVSDVPYKVAVPEPPLEEDLAEPAEGNMEAGAADIAEGQACGFIADAPDLGLR